MRGVQGAHSARHADPRGELGRTQVPDVFLAQAPLPVGGQLRLQPLVLSGRGRHRQLAALDQIRVDVLRVADPGHLADRLLELPLQVEDPGPAGRVTCIAIARAG